MSGERPLYLIHEASSIPLLFNLSGDTIFSRVKATVTAPSVAAVTQNYLLHPSSSWGEFRDTVGRWNTSQENKKNFQGPEKNQQLVQLVVWAKKNPANVYSSIFCENIWFVLNMVPFSVCLIFMERKLGYQQGKNLHLGVRETPGPWRLRMLVFWNNLQMDMIKMGIARAYFHLIFKHFKHLLF